MRCETMVWSACALLMMAGIVGFSSAAWARTDVDVAEAREMWQDGVFTLDVRTTGEYETGHIPGVPYIDVNELESRLGELAGRESSDILLHCKSGVRSVTAAGILEANGFTAVFNMLGGFDAWKAAGYEVEVGDPDYGTLTPQQAYARWEEGVFFLDVRSTMSYLLGHVKDADHIVGGELADRLDELAGRENDIIVVYCSGTSCGAGNAAAQILADNGFTAVYVMSEGFPGWVDAGYPVEAAWLFGCHGGTGAGRTGGALGSVLLLALVAGALMWLPGWTRGMS
ncbi:MAG: hypothetical protein GWP08_12745 [Nitrospiraceae bacterium]|nr:hypothetical protein [Nitrospiraceae bacterium]